MACKGLVLSEFGTVAHTAAVHLVPFITGGGTFSQERRSLVIYQQ